ncbi:MAG: hypothetical protein INR70_29980 [Parafilimonas terrae]|nr:hypothetical protein [Parafilimonas terrae]
MHCAACPDDRRAAFATQGCHMVLAELRTATLVGSADLDLLQPLHLEPGQVAVHPAPSAGDMALQLHRLDLRHGDILVIRTSEKLQPATAEKWQDELIRLCEASGFRDVTVLVLDNATEITVERPETRLVQQRREVPQPMQSC